MIPPASHSGPLQPRGRVLATVPPAGTSPPLSRMGPPTCANAPLCRSVTRAGAAPGSSSTCAGQITAYRVPASGTTHRQPAWATSVPSSSASCVSAGAGPGRRTRAVTCCPSSGDAAGVADAPAEGLVPVSTAAADGAAGSSVAGGVRALDWHAATSNARTGAERRGCIRVPPGWWEAKQRARSCDSAPLVQPIDGQDGFRPRLRIHQNTTATLPK